MSEELELPVTADLNHKSHPMHPSHPDNHPHRAHHPHSQNIKFIFGFFILFTSLFMLLVGYVTNAPFGNVIISFLPSYLLGILGLYLISTDHFDLKYVVFAMLSLLLITGLFFSLYPIGLDVLSVIGINLLLDSLLIVILFHSHHQEPKEEVIEVPAFSQDLTSIFDDIEREAKIINRAVGRAYSITNGGSLRIRNLLKIDPEWYNQLGMDKKPKVVKEYLELIKKQVDLLQKSEDLVFSKEDIRKFRNLNRKPDGSSRIIDVLSVVEGDDVKKSLAIIAKKTDYALSKLV